MYCDARAMPMEAFQVYDTYKLEFIADGAGEEKKESQNKSTWGNFST